METLPVMNPYVNISPVIVRQIEASAIPNNVSIPPASAVSLDPNLCCTIPATGPG